MKSTLFVLLSLIMLFAACRKKDNAVTPSSPIVLPPNPPVPPTPAVTITSLSGTVNPAGSITDVSTAVVADDGRLQTISGKPGSDGRFQLANLPAGIYIIRFTATSGYTTPEPQTVKVMDKQLFDMGTINLQKTVPGSISGLVSPSNSVAKVSVSLALGIPGAPAYTAVPDAGGHFIIPNLNPGKYYITVIPVTGSGLNAPNTWPVNVPNGQNAQVGEIRMTPALQAYPVSVVMDGKPYNATSFSQASYTSSKLSMSVNLGNGALSIQLDGVTGPGDYTCNRSSKSTATFQRMTFVEIMQIDWVTVLKCQSWSSYLSDTGITVKITSIDPVTQTVTGTFSGSLLATNAYTKGMNTFTGGAFYLPYSTP